MKIREGTILKNRYRVDESLGRGGMADVYKVWDKTRADALAMKVLREDLAQDRIFLRRFEREAQTLAKLQHRSIVRFYGLEQDDLLVFLLMEYIEGTSLREEIFRAKEPFTSRRILEVLRPICAAMHYAHCMGIVHCDLKPGNILIDHRGEPLVTDFGIARMIDASTATMVGLGTPAYMAPELVKGQDPTPQTDIYALGVILYEMLTGGERPFTGERAKITGSTAERIRWEQMKLAPRPLTDYNSAISPEVQEVVLRCLAKIPDQRYIDIQAVYEKIKTIFWNKTERQSFPKAENLTPKIKKERERVFSVKEEDRENEIIDGLQKSISISEVWKNKFITHLSVRQGLIEEFDLKGHLIAISDRNALLIRDFYKNETIGQFSMRGSSRQVHISKSGNLIFTNDLDRISVFQLNNGKIKNYLESVSSKKILEFDISSDGGYCIGILEDGMIICWDLKKGESRLWTSIYSDSFGHIKAIPESDIFVRVSDTKKVQFSFFSSFKKIPPLLKNIPSGEKNIICSVTGKYLALWNEKNYISIIEIENLIIELNKFSFLNDVALLENNELNNAFFMGFSKNKIHAITFTNDERYLITIDAAGIFTVLENKSLNKICQFELEIQGINKVLVSDDGQYLVTVCKGERLDYWRLNWEGALS